MAECALDCGRDVDEHADETWKEVRGFVGGPRKDSMRLREDTGRFAHAECVQRAQEGQAPGQETMF